MSISARFCSTFAKRCRDELEDTGRPQNSSQLGTRQTKPYTAFRIKHRFFHCMSICQSQFLRVIEKCLCRSSGAFCPHGAPPSFFPCHLTISLLPAALTFNRYACATDLIHIIEQLCHHDHTSKSQFSCQDHEHKSFCDRWHSSAM